MNNVKVVIIRKAVLNDAEAIAECLLLAMEDIVYLFIGEKNREKAKAFLLRFAEKENNQYSYQNCRVVEKDGKVVAAANVYDGARLKKLRAPILAYLKTELNNALTPEDETQPGEYYIDSIGVRPGYQGTGVGTTLLQFLVDEYVVRGGNTLGLLVGESNPKAKRLYLKLGFKTVGTKIFMGKKMDHLQMRT